MQSVFIQPSGPATPNNITQEAIGALLYPVLSIEGNTVVNGIYPYGYVDRYGSNTTPGTTNMLGAIAAAFASGFNVQFLPGMQYSVGAISGLGTLLTISGLTNISVLGNGAIITSNTTFINTLAVPVIFSFVNAENLTIDNLGCFDSGFDITQAWKGPTLFNFGMSDGNDRKRITIQNCKFKNVVSPIVFTSSGGGTGRYRGIKISGCTGDGCFYGPSFQQNGDEADIEWTAINAVRAYFPYGVAGHNANIHVWHDATSQGANACIDIKRYANDTKNIRLRADFHGYTSQ